MKNHLFSENSLGLEFRRHRRRQRAFDASFGLEKICRRQAKREPVWLENLSAIVAVSDDGGSSRQTARRIADAAAGRYSQLHGRAVGRFASFFETFSASFRGDGDLGGHSFGNLFLAALTEITGDFAEAVKLSSEILASKGHIYPATVADVRLDGRT